MRRLPQRALPVCVGLPFVYAAVVLVLWPEGDPSLGERVLAAAAIASGAGLAIAIARVGSSGVRGAAMLLLGFGSIAVFGGVVVSRLRNGLGLREVLGAAVGIAGLVLVIAGWRRALAGWRRPWAKALVAVAASFLVLQFLLLPAILALDVTNRGRPTASGRTPADLGLTFEDLRIPSWDGAALAAWWIPSQNGAAVVLLPGSGSTRDDVLDHAAMLASAGYGALLLDWRGHGDSQGRPMEFGWNADRDVEAAIDAVEARPEVTAGIGLLGLSMGGEVALTTAASDPRVDAVVAEGASARTLTDARLEPDAHPVSRANEWLMFPLVELLAPEPEPAPLFDAVRALRAPTLLIAGAPANESTLTAIYADASPELVTRWSLPDTPHIGGLSTHPTEYRERVLGLFDATLLTG